MTDPLPSDIRLLLAADWTRHEPDDGEPLWIRSIAPEDYYSTDAAAKRQLRAMGWICTAKSDIDLSGYWEHPNHGFAPSFSVACDWARETIEQQLRDHSKAPSSHGNAASPPASGADPPGEPEPAGGDVELPPIEQVLELLDEERLHNCDRTGLLDTLGWVRDWIELLNERALEHGEQR